MFNFSFWKNCEEDKEDTGAISLDNLGGVFIIIMGGIFVAVITLGFEYCYYKKKEHSRVESAVVKLGEDVEKDFWLHALLMHTWSILSIEWKILHDIFIK